MKIAKNNPTTNVLGSGLQEQDISEAIRASGYPLQILVYEMLSKQFRVKEEWAYIDSDTEEERTIDLIAQMELFEFQEPQPRIRPSLNLIIECKQTDLPYVFFLAKGSPYTHNFPLLAGLASKNIVITSDDDPSSWSYSVLQALELSSHSFLKDTPVFSNTFTKGSRKGKKVELSGSQSYQGLVLPLLKAVAYFEKCEAPSKTAVYFDCHVTVPLAVIDGPMIGVRCENGENELEMLPWVRIPRHQPTNENDHSQHMNTTAIDVVHKDFVDDYIEKHLLPFAKDFSDLALKHQEEIADAKGFISGMEKNGWSDIENRLSPRTLASNTKRTKALLNNLIDQTKE